MEDYVHKEELLSKKRQLLAMSEEIENFEIKINNCENMIQSFQQKNIVNMNREALKRKEIATDYH